MTARLGWRVWALGVIALGLVGLAFGAFDPGQPVPADLPERKLLAYVVDGFMVIAGAAVLWRRTLAWAAAALTAYYALVVVVLMNGRMVLSHPKVFEAYGSTAEQLAIASAALIVFATSAKLGRPLSSRLVRTAQIAFGICALLFGAAHFIYLNQTAPLVPSWLPPSQVFWAYATGVAHIVAGLAILSGVQARLAAILLTVMYAAFTPFVHLPQLAAHPQDHFTWAENALNIALTGAAWVVADSLGSRIRRRARS